ncbi:MAG: cysteine--tRNA ligase [Puniceicoccales bacterium]|jgi:cysteinyl-tRNA synthetase|nr:cysteine--tRNA ligase [Puniceicoccales bacterium]
METIKLYNTQSRAIEVVVPQHIDNVLRIYCCGPTVYHYAHIGNFRTFLIQDILRRLLLAMGHRLRFVRNLTDVDDKTIHGAQRENTSLENFTAQWTHIFHTDCQELNILDPDVEPRATEHIGEQIAMIETLIRKKHAYVVSEGSVYFRISSYTAYGKLSGIDRQSLQNNEHGATQADLADEYGRDSIRDFALWKAYKPEDGAVFWESPWGKGRPGWHIECSAMAMKYLGETIDIHGGGIDLCFPHHENEIAQSVCVTGKPFVRHWFHSEHLQVDGQKMSKSLGNLFTLKDLKNKGYGVHAIRYALISGHYRQILNFTLSGLDAAQSALNKLKTKIMHLFQGCDFSPAIATNFPSQAVITYEYLRGAIEALKCDLNVPQCLGEIFAVLNNATVGNEQLWKELQTVCSILGIETYLFDREEPRIVEIPRDIEILAARRWQAKQDKNFKESDHLRRLLMEQGWSIIDHQEGYRLEKKRDPIIDAAKN